MTSTLLSLGLRSFGEPTVDRLSNDSLVGGFRCCGPSCSRNSSIRDREEVVPLFNEAACSLPPQAFDARRDDSDTSAAL
jgi:hypothetical protein